MILDENSWKKEQRRIGRREKYIIHALGLAMLGYSKEKIKKQLEDKII